MMKKSDNIRTELEQKLAAKKNQRADLLAGVKTAKAEAERLKKEKSKYALSGDVDGFSEIMTQIQFFENLAKTKQEMLKDMGSGFDLTEIQSLWSKHLAIEEPKLRSIESRYLKAKSELLNIYRELLKARANLVDDSNFFQNCADTNGRTASLKIPQICDPASREMYSFFEPQLKALGISMLDERFRFDWFGIGEIQS